jgi:hypothetical protein
MCLDRPLKASTIPDFFPGVAVAALFLHLYDESMDCDNEHIFRTIEISPFDDDDPATRPRDCLLRVQALRTHLHFISQALMKKRSPLSAARPEVRFLYLVGLS